MKVEFWCNNTMTREIDEYYSGYELAILISRRVGSISIWFEERV